MKKKALTICLAAAMALSAVGFGFAKWSDTADAKVTPNTGSLKLGWVPFSYMDHDSNPHYLGDFHAQQGLVGIYPDPEEKEVASTTGTFQDIDQDGKLEWFNVTIDNAYPFYYNEISAKIQNFGSIPMIIQKPTLHWQETKKVIEDGFVYWLGKDGQIIGPYAPGYNGNDPALEAIINTPVKVGDNWVLELRWMDNADKQLHPGTQFEESFELQVLQAADQKTKYQFGISVEGIQWNEIR